MNVGLTGPSYDGNTGIFTAPVDGYYQFSHQVLPDIGCSTGPWMRTYLEINGEVISWTVSTWPNTHATVEVVEMKAGDKAWISMAKISGCRITDRAMKHNGFSGILIHTS